jgi:trans-aconitate 2-methyltransferase
MDLSGEHALRLGNILFAQRKYASRMPWDPDQYLRFADHRTRPGVELLARIPDLDPRRIMDLGCGTAHLTALLQHRWPSANVTGIDSSVEMIEQARLDHPDMQWIVEDVATWEPDGEMDLNHINTIDDPAQPQTVD